MLFNNSDLYEYLSEGKKTNEMNDVVKQYSHTIRELTKDVREAIRDKDYNKAEKLLNEKKKIIRTLEKSINDVDIDAWDSIKGNVGFGFFALPSIIRVVNWSSKLGFKSGSSLSNGLSYTGCLFLANLLTTAIGLPGVGSMVYQMCIKPENLENLTDTAHTHPSKTNLLKVVDAAMKETENQIRYVKRLKSVNESYITAAIENYIDTVLEDAINDDFLIEGKIYSVNNFKLNIHNMIKPSNFKTGKNLPEMRRKYEEVYSNSNDLRNLKFVRDQLPHNILQIDTYLKNKADKLSSEEAKNYKEQRNWIKNRLLPLIERRIKELENKKNIKKESFIDLDIFDDLSW